MSESPATPFVSHFARLRDPRQAVKALSPLPKIRLLLLCAPVSEADDFVEIELWGEAHLAFPRRFLPFVRGIPSRDTLCNVIASIDRQTFKTCFLSWTDSLRVTAPATDAGGPGTIAIDGKPPRRATRAAKDGCGCTPSRPGLRARGWGSARGAVAGKYNKIIAIPWLLQRLVLTGALITIDAIVTQKAVAQTILEGGGDYVLALKENWTATVAEFFAAPLPEAVIHRYQRDDGDHGRIETPRHAVCLEIAWLIAGPKHPDAFDFPGLAAVGCVESETVRDGRTLREQRFYQCSTTFDVETFASATRGHWGIESSVH
jgi:predicted transposase YbfD/YdcC